MEKHAQLKRAVVLCTLILALVPTAWAGLLLMWSGRRPARSRSNGKSRGCA